MRYVWGLIMRDLQRNKRTIWYANHIRDEIVTDEFGNDTVETVPVYTDPIALKINISAATGEAAAEAFGAFTDYSRTITTSDTRCPLKQNSRVWFGVEPSSSPHNYEVVRVADSLNGMLYALREVTVS